ncbi:MAG: type II secretion system F family protein [Burkholderiales bacterium]|nr:type II secretion system F family protein [Burkholderiales bacterium]OJX08747.1 MAG: type II secretion system protein [Burkholderiales bacterium 70-64]
MAESLSQELYLFLAVLFVAVAGAVYSLGALITGGRAVRARLRGVVGRAEIEHPDAPEWHARMVKAAAPVARLATPTSEEDVSKVRAKFLHAGFRDASAPVVYFALKALLAIALPVLLLLFTDVRAREGYQPALFLLIAGAVGYYLPNVVLARLTFVRQRELFEAFPDALDLIIVCVEAGLSLDAAIARAAGEIRLRSPVLADELHLVGLELRVGATRERALRNLAARTGLTEISSFVAMMLQADRFGTSIADSLRVQADSLRVRRRQHAEEQAAKIPLKMLFPLIFCIFPSLLLVLLGPALIQIYRILLPTMSGGG